LSPQYLSVGSTLTSLRLRPRPGAKSGREASFDRLAVAVAYRGQIRATGSLREEAAACARRVADATSDCGRAAARRDPSWSLPPMRGRRALPGPGLGPGPSRFPRLGSGWRPQDGVSESATVSEVAPSRGRTGLRARVWAVPAVIFISDSETSEVAATMTRASEFGSVWSGLAWPGPGFGLPRSRLSTRGPRRVALGSSADPVGVIGTRPWRGRPEAVRSSPPGRAGPPMVRGPTSSDFLIHAHYSDRRSAVMVTAY
jgi:hypothetical protein